MMKTYRLTTANSLNYPVGENISTNMDIIERMGDKISRMINKYYTDKKKVHFVCRGSSGTIVSALVSNIITKKTNKIVYINHIKKDGEKTHSSHRLPHNMFTESVVIVIDDFIETGETIRAIVSQIRRQYSDPIHILCVSGQIHLDDETQKEFIYGICSKIR